MRHDEDDYADDCDDEGFDPTGCVVIVENDDGDEVELAVTDADYERPDRSVGAHGGWVGTLSDGRDFTVEDGYAVCHRTGRKIGKLT